MNNEEVFEMINSSVQFLLDSVEVEEGPYRFKDLRIFIYILRGENQRVKMSDLANYLHITPSAISQLIQKYEDEGYVKRVKDEIDRRKVYVQVEENVKENIQKEWMKRKNKIIKFLEFIGQEDAEAVYRILYKLKEVYQYDLF